MHHSSCIIHGVLRLLHSPFIACVPRRLGTRPEAGKFANGMSFYELDEAARPPAAHLAHRHARRCLCWFCGETQRT